MKSSVTFYRYSSPLYFIFNYIKSIYSLLEVHGKPDSHSVPRNCLSFRLSWTKLIKCPFQFKKSNIQSGNLLSTLPRPLTLPQAQVYERMCQRKILKLILLQFCPDSCAEKSFSMPASLHPSYPPFVKEILQSNFKYTDFSAS